MDRRSFLTTLVGGFAAASLGGVALANAAPALTGAVPAPETDTALPASVTEAVDATDAEYAQYYRRRRYYRRGYGYRRPYRRYGRYGRGDRRTRSNSQR